MSLDFENGWSDLPERLQSLWSQEGRLVNGSNTCCMYGGIPTFNGWAETIRNMWRRQIFEMERQLQNTRVQWNHVIGNMNWYPFLSSLTLTLSTLSRPFSVCWFIVAMR